MSTAIHEPKRGLSLISCTLKAKEKTKDKTTNDGVTVDSISLALYGGWGGSKAIYKKDKASSQAGN